MNKYEHLIEKLSTNDRYTFYNVEKLDKNKYAKLPFCMRILVESLVRNYDNNNSINEIDVNNCINWCDTHKSGRDVYIPYMPARVILQDFSGVPAIIDFASMRNLNADNQNIHSLCPADVVLDHAIVDVPKKICIQKPPPPQTGCPLANSNQLFIETGYIECPFHNTKTECADEIKAIRELKFERDKERLMLLKWSSKSIKNVVLVPPFNGISHKTNIECLARIVFNKSNLLYPDSVFGTDSHTTMTNGLGLLSLDMGAIECENVMLGQSVQIKLPHVVGYKIVGKPNDYVSSIDIILAITKHLRQLALNNDFVEFFGCGCTQLTIVERETISHMCAEYGALVGYFSIDAQTMDYFRKTGRTSSNCDIIEDYLKAVKLFRDYNDERNDEICYSKIYEFDLSNVVTYCSGPRRTQDKCVLEDLYLQFKLSLTESVGYMGFGLNSSDVEKTVDYVYDNECYKIGNGSVLIASIDSYTNSSNPTMLLTAGLLAKKAYEMGLKVKPYIKTSLSPGSGLLTKHYLIKSGLIKYLELIGFNIVGYGCQNCIENSVELDDNLVKLVEKNELVTVGVLSGNRNSENRNKSVTKANYLVPPTLVILYSIVGHINICFDATNEPILINQKTNENIYASDLLPTRDEIRKLETQVIIPEIYNKIDKQIFNGNEQWNSLNVQESYLYPWNYSSTYIKRVPFFDNITIEPKQIETIKNAHVLLYLGDTITTDHISPAGCISRNSPAGKYLIQQKVAPRDFNSFGSRRGNHDVMARSAFYNQRLGNKLVKANTLAKTIFIPKSMELDVFDAAEMYKHEKIPVIILAGKEYGSGASRDWSVKGQWMLGVKAVIAESFNDTHRSNLLGMGILPLRFINGENSLTLGLTGKERFTINLNDNLTIKQLVDVQIDDKQQTIKLEACIYNKTELAYFKHGGLLNYSYRQFVN